MTLVEDYTTFFAEFGVDATVDGDPVRGIFDAAYAGPLGVSGVTPMLLCAAVDVASATSGTAVVIGSVSYTVTTPEPDGTGLTRLMLEAAA